MSFGIGSASGREPDPGDGALVRPRQNRDERRSRKPEGQRPDCVEFPSRHCRRKARVGHPRHSTVPRSPQQNSFVNFKNPELDPLWSAGRSSDADPGTLLKASFLSGPIRALASRSSDRRPRTAPGLCGASGSTRQARPRGRTRHPLRCASRPWGRRLLLSATETARPWPGVLHLEASGGFLREDRLSVSSENYTRCLSRVSSAAVPDFCYGLPTKRTPATTDSCQTGSHKRRTAPSRVSARKNDRGRGASSLSASPAPVAEISRTVQANSGRPAGS